MGCDLFTMARRQIDVAAERLGLQGAVRRLLALPRRELHVSLPVKMDDGRTEVFSGFRVQYNDARGPCKGGIRFHPREDIDTIRALAAWMAWKTAVMDLPLGGGKGGVVCDPRRMSRAELERLSRAYVRQVGPLIADELDVPAPDVYTNPRVMAWMLDEYEAMHGGRHSPGAVTGKPLALGGSPGRDEATARGGCYVVREAAKVLGLDTRGATVAVQGFGNAGQHAALLSDKLLGCKILAVSDTSGAIYNDRGLDTQALVRYKLEEGRVAGFPEAESIKSEELLQLPVDILFPAALELTITEHNAPRIRAKISCELANGPQTPEADAILADNGVFFIPDILANAGGVTVSYLEMVQNATRMRWTAEQVYQELDRRMSEAFRRVHERASREGVDMRVAAHLVALERVAEAMRFRGWV